MKRRSIWMLLVALMLEASHSVHAQNLSIQGSKIDSLFAKYTSNTPGCVIGVIKDGKWLVKKSFGSANLDYNIPLSSTSKFYIASVSKQFTAACINLLIMQNKIHPEDKIRTYIPELPEYTSNISIQHLLNHTSGLRDYLTLRALEGKSLQDYFNIQDCIDQLIRQKGLSFNPGDKFSYSNSGYVLLAEVVNRVSGTTIRKFAQEHIFTLLGMTNTFFNDNHKQVIKDRVISYRKRDDDSFVQSIQNFDALGDGNVISALDDLFLWDQNFIHKKVGGDRFAELMLRRGETNDGQKLNYASGLFVDEYRSFKTVHHAGNLLGFRAKLLRFPELNLTVIFLGNLSSFDGSDEAYHIADLFLPVRTKQPDIKPYPGISSDKLRPYTGVFQSPDNPSVTVTMSIKGDSLMAHPKWIKDPYLTYPVSGNEFVKNTDGEVRYIFAAPAGSQSKELNLKLGNQTFTLMRTEPVDTNALNLREYEGEYYSEELNTRYSLKITDGKLRFKAGEWGLVVLEPLEKDIFYGEDESVSFTRNGGSSDINGFVFSVARARGIRFTKETTVLNE